MPRSHRRRSLAVLGLATLLASCNPEGIIAPLRDVRGVWRGNDWGLDATDGSATLHHICGNEASVAGALTWDLNLRARGTAEWPWNEVPDAADLSFVARATPDGRLILSVTGMYGGLDTLRRAPRASFVGEAICD